MLELMGRSGMHIGEFLRISLDGIKGRNLILHEHKIGKDNKIVYIDRKVADRLRENAYQICERDCIAAHESFNCPEILGCDKR